MSAAMTARRQKVCLIRSVQPMNRSTSAAGDRGDGLTLQDDSSAHVSAGRSEENIAREGAVQSRAARVGRGAERAERERAECFIQLKAESCSRMELLWISNSDEYGSTELHLNMR